MIDLKDKNVVYTFDTKDDYIDLMIYLEDNGAKWINGLKPTEVLPYRFKKHRKDYKNKDYRTLEAEMRNTEVEMERGVLMLATKTKNREQFPHRKYVDFEYIHWKKRQETNMS